MIPDDKDNEEMSEEERAAAAEWEAMAGAGDEAPAEGEQPAAGGPKSNRVLDQDEIDSLLGLGAGGGGEDEKPSGIQAIINSALVSYERLLMLEIVFDRLVRMLSTSLRNFTSDNVEVSLDSITAIRFVGERASERQALPVEPMTQHRRLASGCPRRSHRGQQRDPGLVLEDDQCVLAPGPFFSCGQRCFTH